MPTGQSDQSISQMLFPLTRCAKLTTKISHHIHNLKEINKIKYESLFIIYYFDSTLSDFSAVFCLFSLRTITCWGMKPYPPNR